MKLEVRPSSPVLISFCEISVNLPADWIKLCPSLAENLAEALPRVFCRDLDMSYVAPPREIRENFATYWEQCLGLGNLSISEDEAAVEVLIRMRQDEWACIEEGALLVGESNHTLILCVARLEVVRQSLNSSKAA